MSLLRFTALALAICALVGSGCGSSSKKSTPTAASSTVANAAVTNAPDVSVPAHSGPLTRAELIATGDAICYRLNVRRKSTRIEHPSDHERLVPALAAYEMAGAVEMSKLVPPASMSGIWQHIVNGSHTIAVITARFPRYSEATNDKLTLPSDIALGKAIDEVTHAAKKAGFKECSRWL